MNKEKFKYKNITFDACDVGGQTKFREIWEIYYKNEDFQAVIFVIDSTDKARMNTANEELEKLSQEEKLEDSIFLLFLNKKDTPDAMGTQEILKKLNIQNIKYRAHI